MRSNHFFACCHCSVYCRHCVRDWQLGKYTRQRSAWRQQLATDYWLCQIHRWCVHHLTWCHQSGRRRLRLLFKMFICSVSINSSVSLSLTPSMPALPNCCHSKGSTP